MAIEPQSQVILVKAPLGVDNQHQLTFNDKNAQLDYFANLPRLAIHPDDYTYVRKDSVIKYGAPVDDLRAYNYLFYKNDAYTNKVFYAFITELEYVNDNMTYIHISTDVWQTWQFDLNFRNSFVEREHVTNDAIGANTIPEGLEYGEYVVNGFSEAKYASSLADCYIMAQVTELIPPMSQDKSRIYTGIPQGCYLIGFEIEPTFYLKNFIEAYDKAGKADAIVSMFVVPKSLCDPVLPVTWDTSPAIDAFIMPSSKLVKNMSTHTFKRNSTINGYAPKNNKLFCSPYNYLMVTNNGGQDIKFNWEDFSDKTNAVFNLKGCVAGGMSGKLIPSNYKQTNEAGGFEYSLNAQKLPVLSWISDHYLNWEAVNGKNVEIQTGLQAGKFATSVIGGMLSGNLGSMINAPLDLAGNVANTMQQIREAEITPDQAKGNASTGDFNFTNGKCSFTAYNMSIKAEYARIIDQYFSAFGYKVNTLKVPNINTRPNWNYVKCTSCNITANIPQDDLDAIKALFNRGITLWHNPATYLDYSQGNK